MFGSKYYKLTYKNMTILALIVYLVVLGIIAYLVNLAPFIQQTFKTFIVYVLILIGAIILISFVLGLVGSPTINLR